MRVVCNDCQNEYTITLGIPSNISCQKCGSFDINMESDVVNKLFALCTLCGDYFEIKVNETQKAYHDKSKCKCQRIVLFEKLPDGKEILVPGEKVVEVEEPIFNNLSSKARKFQVSSIVVCHNGLDMTKKCIDKLRLSSILNEIILVDNNSTDGTGEWAEKQEDIIYIRNNMNLGCGIGRNQGASWASSEYLFFLDNDQFVSYDTIEKLLSINVDLVGVDAWEVEKDCFTRRSTGNVKRGYIGSGGLLIKRSVFETINGYDSRFSPAWYEDVDFCMRAKLLGYKVVHKQDARIEHLGNQTTLKIQKDFNWEEQKRKSRELFSSMWKEYLFSGRGKPYNIVPMKRKIPKKSIGIVVDVKGWAWDYKTQQIVRHLSDEFEFHVIYGPVPNLLPKDLDIYFSYEVGFFDVFNFAPKSHKITGVTAHTYKNMTKYKEKLTNCWGIHANSKMLFEEIKEYNAKCFYLPNGVDPELFPYRERDTRDIFCVGYVGKDSPPKGLKEYIIPACEKAGVKLKMLTEKYKSTKKVAHRDMAAWYADVDCVIIASTMDGTPNMLLEAASVGRTFIGNKIGNVPEFCVEGENGYMLAKRDIETYVERITWLKDNRDECKRLGLNARQTVLSFWTWEIQAENYREMFREALKRKKIFGS